MWKGLEVCYRKRVTYAICHALIVIVEMFYEYIMACVMWTHTHHVISEWRSHSWHYFIVQNSSKCKPTQIHQINIKCTVCNKNNNKLMFNPFVETIFIVYRTCQISQHKCNSCVLHGQIEHWFVLVVKSLVVLTNCREQCQASIFCQRAPWRGQHLHSPSCPMSAKYLSMSAKTDKYQSE